MICVGKLWICLAGGLLFNAGLRAAEASLDSPYVPIVNRNVFDIHPPPPPDPNQDVPPPPKITPDGIMSVFGRVQVLYKVAIPPKPGQSAKEQSYILGEGQAEDDIEVTKIDEQAGIVTFNNHGTIQELPLVNTPASGSAAPASSGPGPGATVPPRFYIPGGGNPAGNPGNPGGVIRFGQSSQNDDASQVSRPGVALAGGGGNSSPQPVTQPHGALSADDQSMLIAARRSVALQQGDPTAILYPQTEHDAEAGIPPASVPGSSPPQ